MKYLLDTNVISELVARVPNQQVMDWIDNLNQHEIYLSVITIGEIRKSIEKLPISQRKNQLTTWLKNELLPNFSNNLVDITVDVMLAWGKLTGMLERTGKPIAALDSLIAASAIEGGFILVTRNIDDFQYTGVQMLNPWKN